MTASGTTKTAASNTPQHTTKTHTTMTLTERLWRIANRCGKQKHTPKTNRMGITWCTDCGQLIK